MEHGSATSAMGGADTGGGHPVGNAGRIPGSSWRPPITMYARGLKVTTLIKFADPEPHESPRAIAEGSE